MHPVARKRIFISFDYDHDRDYRHLLSALNANRNSDINFYDLTPEEIQSSDVGRIKAVLTRKIRESTHCLAVIGKHANTRHRDAKDIGTRNWQWWEIQKSKDEGKGLIAVKIDRSYDAPDPIMNAGARWAVFTVDSMLRAIQEA